MAHCAFAAAWAASAGGTVSVTIIGPSAAVSATTGITVTVTGSATPSLLPRTTLDAGSGTATQPTSAVGSPGSAAQLSGGGTSVAATNGASTAAGDTSALPGGFTVAGEAGQAFNITMPTQLLVNTPNGVVLLKDFQHSAGTTPAVSPDGRLRVAFEASVATDPSEVLPLLMTASGENDNVLVLEVESADSEGGVRRVTARRVSAFAMPDDRDVGIMVLISYN